MASDLEPYQASNTPALRAGDLDYPTMLQLGAAFAASGLFPGVKDQGVAVIKILAGAEMGLEPVAAMNGIDIIAMPNRPPRMRPNTDVQALLARRAGYDFTPLEHTAEKCVLEWRHNGKVLGTSEFSVAQAQKARLVRDGGAWQAWPENMTLARAITQGVKLYCRHLLAGSIGGMQIVTTDELEQEYPDPRDDLVKALHATYREVFSRDPGEDEESYRIRRLDWSGMALGRHIETWNGPQAPETLTRADCQILLDELARLQAAPDSGPSAPTPPTPTVASGADHLQTSAGDSSSGDNPGAAGIAAPSALSPAEHHTDEGHGEASPEGEGPGGVQVTPDVPAGQGSTPAAPTRQRHVVTTKQIREAQKDAAQTRRQTVVEHPPSKWRWTLPRPLHVQILNAKGGSFAEAEQFIATFAEQEGLPPLSQWTPDTEWPDDKLELLRRTVEAEGSAQ